MQNDGDQKHNGGAAKTPGKVSDRNQEHQDESEETGAPQRGGGAYEGKAGRREKREQIRGSR